MDTNFRIGSLQLRDERPADVSDIGRVTAEAFGPMPFGDGTEASLIAALRSAGALTVSLVATADGQLVGHVAFSPVMIDDRASTWFQLSPISVAPHVQRRGVGDALIKAGLDRLWSLGAGGCVLTGDPRYYRRFGFTSDPALTLQGQPNRFLQRLVLSGPPAVGDVRFHPAFGD